MPLLKKPITIGAGAWVCADALVGPGVTVGDHAIVGARTVVIRDMSDGCIVMGNRARNVGSRQ